jgi:hypothetical protein
VVGEQVYSRSHDLERQFLSLRRSTRSTEYPKVGIQDMFLPINSRGGPR